MAESSLIMGISQQKKKSSYSDRVKRGETWCGAESGKEKRRASWRRNK